MLRELIIASSFFLVSANYELDEGESCITDGFHGTCRDIRYCPTAALIDIKEKHPTVCSYVGKQPIVCCTDCDSMDSTKIVVTLEGVKLKQGTNKSYDNCLEFVSKLPYPCKTGVGVVVAKKLNEKKQCHYLHTFYKYFLIGELAKRGEFPHMALLGYGEDVESAQWSCGGSVISERFILTAGHCSQHPAIGHVSFVAVGILRRSDPASLWQRLRVRRFLAHPEYRPPSKYNDIALIETADAIQFSAVVLPICLADRELEAAQAQAEGWGAEGHNQQSSDGLRKAVLERFSDEECDALYPQHRHQTRGVDRGTQVCYGDHAQNKDTCQGDSGGPLQVSGRSCAEYVVGVTSYGRACGAAGGAGVYTRVLPYLKWIEGHVWP